MIPLLSLAQHPTEQKRKLPPSAPQSEPKRQLLHSAYDEIINDAIKTFGPVLYVCTSNDPKTFTYEFWGRGRDGQLGWIKLFFRIQLNSLTRPTDPRNYVVSFRVYDKQGMIQNIPEMFENQTPPIVSIPCGGGAEEVKSKIVHVLDGWLNFAQRYAA